MTINEILYITALCIVLFTFIYQFIIRYNYNKEIKEGTKNGKYQKPAFKTYLTNKFLITSTAILVIFILMCIPVFSITNNEQWYIYGLSVFVVVFSFNFAKSVKTLKG